MRMKDFIIDATIGIVGGITAIVLVRLLKSRYGGDNLLCGLWHDENLRKSMQVIAEHSIDILYVEWKKQKKTEKEKKARDVTGSMEAEEEAKIMTLGEHEKLRNEKIKLLEAKTEERIITLDKEFEDIELLEKKKDEGVFVQLKAENDNQNKKIGNDK